MASRNCITTLPSYLQDLAQIPHRGPVGRVGLEQDQAAAGNPYPAGEPDGRTSPTIDNLRGKRKLPAAVRFRSPQPEPRTRDINNVQRRRSFSAPPESQSTHTDRTLPLQIFKVLPNIDSGVHGRRQGVSPPPGQVCRHAAAKKSIEVGDINGVLSRKHYCGASSPKRSPSPHAIAAMQSIDIDARRARPTPRYGGSKLPAQGSSPSPQRSKGILPFDSPSYSITKPDRSPGVSPRGRSYDYFEEVLAAERYAKILGRPHPSSDKEFQRMKFTLELEKREKYAKDKQFPPSTMSTTASECSTPLSSLAKSLSKPSLTDASLAKTFSCGNLLKESFSCSSLKADIRCPVSGDKENHIPQLPGSATKSECCTPLTASVASLATSANCSSKQSLTDARSTASLESKVQSISGWEDKLAMLRSDPEGQKLSALHKRAVSEGAESDDLDDVLDAENQREAYLHLILLKMHQNACKRPDAMPLALRRVVASLLPDDDGIPEFIAQDIRHAVRASAETIHKFQGPRGQRKPTYGNYSPRRSPRRSPQRHCNQWVG